MILANVLIQLRLALGEVILRKLLHQAQNSLESAGGFFAGLVERPEPGHIDVGVAGGGHRHGERRARLSNRTGQADQREADALVKWIAKRLTSIENLEGSVERSQQIHAHRVVEIKNFSRRQSRARADNQLAGRRINLDDPASPHNQARDLVTIPLGRAAPALQEQFVRLTIGQPGGEQNLLMVTVASRVNLTVNGNQRFRVAETASLAKRQVKGDGLVRFPIRGNLEGGAQGEFLTWPAPVGIGENFDPLRPGGHLPPIGLGFVQFGGGRVGVGKIGKIRQIRLAAIDQRLDQRQALGNFFDSPADGMGHGLTPIFEEA